MSEERDQILHRVSQEYDTPEKRLPASLVIVGTVLTHESVQKYIIKSCTSSTGESIITPEEINTVSDILMGGAAQINQGITLIHLLFSTLEMVGAKVREGRISV